MLLNLFDCKCLSVVQGPPGMFSELRRDNNRIRIRVFISYMIRWDEWSKLPVCDLKLAYGRGMTSVPDHRLEKTCLNAMSAVSRSRVVSTVFGNVTADLLILDQSPRVSHSTCASGPPNSMHVLPHIHRRIIVDDVRHMLDVYTSRDEIRTHEPYQPVNHCLILNLVKKIADMSTSWTLNLSKIDLRSDGLRSLE